MIGSVARRVGTRLALAILVLWGAATLSFIALHLTAGDPALAILGGPDARPTQEVLDQVRLEYGLNDPVILQYLRYLGRLATGDFGQSYQLRIGVLAAITEQIGATAQLAITAGVLAVISSVALALLTAHRRPWIRSLSSGTEVVLASTPTFIIGFALLIVFAFTFRVFPIGGNNGVPALILPAATLALSVIGTLTQVLRNELEDVLEQPFILTARTRGLRDSAVRVKHALRHAAIPTITMSGFLVAALLGGSVITETLFARQGVGTLLLNAVYAKDIPLVLGVVILSAGVYVVVNLIVDLAYTAVDPRVVTA
ncbi:ABC transporter permease [Microlunatus sp. GCM10028923]|uniref:ABC transporter permease n=1 Tax=Microlunatus sp. GCM10028923 TaxID=3273400 RepID=UPI003620999A